MSRSLAPTALDDTARRRHSTRTAVLLAAYAQAVETLTGRRDLAVGVPVARRNDDVFTRAVTCLIDMVCVRLRDVGLDVAEAGLLAALSHQDVPAHEVARLARRRPLYPAVLVVQDSPEPRLDLPGVTTRFMWTDTAQLDADVIVELLPGPVLRISYRREAVSGAFAADLCETIAESIGELR